MAESTQHKLDRVRPPRVQITYDVQIGDAIQTKELPFVVGVLSDLAGKSELPRVKDRKFVQIDPDNFNDVMSAIEPSLALRVENRLKDDPDNPVNAQLVFRSMDDFEPINIVRQVEPMWELFQARQRLSDLLAKLDGNDALDVILQEEVFGKEDGLKQLREILGGTENANG